MSRQFEWVQTFTGKAFWPLNPNVKDVCIEDIAHALSNICRYNGHTKFLYSVGQHSILMSQTVSKPNKLWALLHDASEAYVCDIPKPFKHSLMGYKEIERRIMKVIVKKFNLTPELPDEVQEADMRIVLNEKAVLFGPAPSPWRVIGDPISGLEIKPLYPVEVEALFLDQYKQLTK